MNAPVTAQVPPSVFHYTTAQGLLGILKAPGSRRRLPSNPLDREFADHWFTLWASDARYLNDSAEISHGAKALADAIRRVHGRDGIPQMHWLANELETFGVNGRVLTAELKETSAEYLAFVTSFSESADDLSQWRAYAESGYCIEFETNALTALTYTMQPWTYPIDRTLPSVSKVVDGLFPVRYTLTATDYDNLARNALSSPYGGSRGALQALGTIKNPTFEAEHEWRLITTVTDVEVRERARAGRGGLLIPYIELSPPAPTDDLAVLSITIGPGPDQQLRRDSVLRFLTSIGMDGVQVDTTATTLR
ncbi:DUF2971 domain-containing protein [Mycobacteroides chelonae]|uniref:DUF2971 domain-containing protein n=1 Tax=Mycobacteroides chelonae TaxID=1774 RepID=A0A1S1M0A1_MYCCH|nr:DUF2971 domain-containing protein [Mycobacteroides chelonae]MBF9315805.1 DUF2971 domain-containing protein [Mycobacteroides chelonae]OHT75711.1 hypothetical protein BKG67_05840 [Mycobacteroides chelonae]OHU77031.1 hypothetical protein BKG84_00010 [Mycobacteroides chelonae]